MRKSETMRAASRLLLSHPILCLLAVLAAVMVVGVLGPLKVVHAADVAVEGENFTTKPTGATIANDTLFSGGQALKFTADGTASHTVTCSTPCDVVLMARAGQSGGRPSFSVNGSTPQAITTSNQVAPEPYTFHLPDSANTISVTASGTGTGHNAFLDVAKFPAGGGGGTPSAAVCADGSDNDHDGKIDYPNDPGCSSSTDNDETDPWRCCLRRSMRPRWSTAPSELSNRSAPTSGLAASSPRSSSATAPWLPTSQTTWPSSTRRQTSTRISPPCLSLAARVLRCGT